MIIFLYYLAGFIIWILCMLFMLTIFKGGHPARREERLR